jgi:L-serine deaminase
MESKSAMEVIVAAPTAGSCGTVGGSLKAVADNLGNSDDELVNAYSSAIMSVSGYDAVIPLDQVLQTVSDVGKTMPSCLKCTGKGGLAVTETALKIKNRLGRL